MTLLQPHEGITGTDRAGDPLVDLDEAAATGIRAVVAHLVDQLHRATLTGRSDALADLRQRMLLTQIGDLVLILDSIHARDVDTHVKGFGYLVARRREWWTTDERWQADLAEHGGGDEYDLERLVEPDAIYVQYGPAPADICRWVNCTVVAAPSVPDYLRANGARCAAP